VEAIQQQPKRMKGLRFATRCATIEQFVAVFQRHCDPQGVFVPTPATRPIGLETAFSIDLLDGRPALRGLGVVLDAWADADNRFGRPGICFGIRKLTADSEKVFEQILVARAVAADRAAAPAAPADTSNTDVIEPPPPPEPETRTPGGELVLPANPLSGIADESLEGFVDCTIYEETGNFFPVEPLQAADDAQDPVAQPPLLAPIPRRPTVLPEPPPLELQPEDLVSEPSIVVAPPPTPTPTPIPSPTSIPTPIPSPMATTVVPAPEFAPVLHEPWLTRTRRSWREIPHERRRRWMIGAGVGVPVLVIVLVAVLAHTGGASEAAPPEPAPPPARVVHATPVAPPPAPKRAAAPAEPAVEEAAAPGGLPVVGSGPCRITVTSTPAGSLVDVDGAHVGPSPIAIAGPCQHRQLAISHPRYETSQRAVSPTTGEPATVDVTLQRPMHHLMIDTAPSGAIISIGGHRAGTSPTNVDIMGFTGLDITISKPPFYRPITKHVYSKVANDRLSVKLAH
jgi:hypothetical protein